MAKQFLEVFPTLQLQDAVRALLEQVDVERITATKRRDFLRIYLSSTHLIAKETIFLIEKQIRRQLFPQTEIVVKIYETYTLSAQYDPRNLMEVYRDSILLELKEYSHIEYVMFKGAEISFPEKGKMHLLVKDNLPARERGPELVRILEKIFKRF